MLREGMDFDDMADVVVDHSFEVFKSKGDAYMTRGYPLDANGIPDESLGSTTVFGLMERSFLVTTQAKNSVVTVIM